MAVSHVLVPLDGSPLADEALMYALGTVATAVVSEAFVTVTAVR